MPRGRGRRERREREGRRNVQGRAGGRREEVMLK